MRRLLLAAALALPLALPLAAQPATGPQWMPMGNALPDFEIAVDSAVAHGGRASVRVAASYDPEGFAGVMTTVPAAPYAGRRVRVSGFLRAASLEGQGGTLWARADSATRTVAFATTEGRRRFGGTTDWTPVSVDLDVPASARTLAIGVHSTARGTLWVDDVTIEPDAGAEPRALGIEPPDVSAFPAPARSAIAAARSPREASRALAGRALDNLVAFTRLTGYVRFFHPSDSALATNWDEFTVRGVRAVERAPTADSLAATLRALFAPIAPMVAIYRAGARPPTPPAAPSGDSVGVVFWQHLGFGVPASAGGRPNYDIYRSVRRRVAAPGGRVPATVPVAEPGRTMPVPDPAHPFAAELGGGVAATVPLALYTATSAVDSLWRPRPAVERFVTADRATRLAAVALLWMGPQHFYPYHEVAHTDWDAALRRALGEAATSGGGEPFDATMERLVAALHDGHGNVFRASVPRVIPDVRLGWVEGRVVVTAAGDSAAAAGVRRGDEVVAVDGRPVADALRDAESRTSGATPQWIRFVALGKLLAGPPGSATVIRLRDPLTSGAPNRDARLARLAAPPPAEPRPDQIAEPRPGVMYVDLGRVTDADVQAALPRLEAARAIVFDMRGYPRGNMLRLLPMLSDSTIRSARFQAPIVTRPDHQGMEFEGEGWVLPPLQPRLRAKVAFLTGGGAISYAESTMGVVEENHLGAIVGETTAGTNGNINQYAVPGGYVVIWTGMRVQKRDGTPHHGVGIRPTVPVTPTLRGIRDGRDEVLERALEVVGARTP
ncbi:MAG: hypothetical protein JO180_04440 [Gemmatirosa sp.]|nr:hypothetical protein [Gemmatirosa sp.]